MRNQIILACLLASGSLCLAGPSLFVQDFTAGDAGTLTEAPRGVSLATLPGGARCLELTGEVDQFDLATITVEPETKYRLNVRARVDGDFTVERNDRAHIDAVKRNGRWDSRYSVIFPDGASNANDQPKSGGGGFILTSEWYDYVHVFYTPPGVRKLIVRVQPRKHGTFVERVELLQDDEDGAINANPDFRYGELNYCGWEPQRDGRIYLRPDGVCVFRSGYGGVSPRFPLRAGKPYRVFARGVGGGTVSLSYFDAQGKKIASRFLLRPTPAGVEVEFTPPDGTASGSVVMYGAVLEAFKVTPIK